MVSKSAIPELEQHGSSTDPIEMATSGERRGKGGGADIGLLERDTGLRNGGERAEDATEGGDERHRRTYDKYRLEVCSKYKTCT